MCRLNHSKTGNPYNMKTLLVLLSLATFALANVVVGNASNWDELVTHKVMLAEFYAPWCGYCKKLAPVWETAAAELQGIATLVKIDATVENSIADKFNIESYPTVIVFIEGKTSEYNGGRTSAEIVSWVNMRAGPAVKTLNDAEQLNTFKGSSNIVVVAYLEPDSTDFAAYQKIAEDHRTVHVFGVSHNTELAKAEGVSVPGIAVYKDFDPNTAIAKFDSVKVLDFIELNSFPLFAEITIDTFKAYSKRGIPIGWLFVDPSDAEKTAIAKEAILKAAKKLVGKISMVWVDGKMYGQMAARVGIHTEDWPVFGIDNKGTFYSYDRENIAFNSNEFQQWVTNWGEGKIEPQIRSDPLPEVATVKGITTIVGDTFKEIVFDSKKDVFIMFHAPWCGHCKNMTPLFEAIAETFEKNENVIIAKLDGTTNDVPKQINVQGYPTIVFVPADSSKTILPYEAGRNTREMEKFIRKYAKSL